jgi:hypothetical protein
MSGRYQMVPDSGTMWDMVTERRPRIPAELADRIDQCRGETSFEAYLREVLTNHADRKLGADNRDDVLFEATRKTLFAYEDPGGTGGYFDRVLNGGWGTDNYENVKAGFVIDDQDFGVLGIYFTKNDLRAFRDAITDALADGPWEEGEN